VFMMFGGGGGGYKPRAGDSIKKEREEAHGRIFNSRVRGLFLLEAGAQPPIRCVHRNPPSSQTPPNAHIKTLCRMDSDGSQVEPLLRERQSVNNSNKMTDEVIRCSSSSIERERERERER
jgi:hypothetical protein